MKQISSLMAVAALGVVSAAAAAEDTGWYVGASGGRAVNNVSTQRLDVNARNFLSSPGNNASTRFSSIFDDRDTTWSLFGGYRFSPYFAAEAAYVDLGTQVYRATSSTITGNTFATSQTRYDIVTQGFTLAGIGRLPLGERFDVHAGPGVFFAPDEVGYSTTHGSGLFWNAGVNFRFNQRWSVGLDWREYLDIGSGDTEFDIKSLSFGTTIKL